MMVFKTKEEMNHFNDTDGLETLTKDLSDGESYEIEYYMKKVELPKVKLEEFYSERFLELKDFKISLIGMEKNQWIIFGEIDNLGTGIIIQEDKKTEEIKKFNEKCSLLFGFELEE